MKPLSYFKNSKELLDKSLRELKRLDEAFSEQSEVEIGDSIFNFFITTYHIKDWLIQSSNIDKTEVENYVKNSEWLSICRDICNSGKHFTIERYCPVAQDMYEPDIPPIIFTGLNGGQIEIKNNRILIRTHENKTYELLELARKSFEEWENFFAENRINE